MGYKSNKKFWDRFAVFYAPLMEKKPSFYREICRKIRPYLKGDMDVLELACGSGQLSFILSKYVKSWIGTDFSEAMILEAKKRGKYEKLRFEIADATSLSFKNEKFDCVLIANALHIMPKPDKAMKEIYRVLKSDGILCAPTFLWKEGHESKFLKKLMSILGFKLYKEWDKIQFKNFIEKHGFSVIEMKLVYGGLAPVAVMIAIKNNIKT